MQQPNQELDQNLLAAKAEIQAILKARDLAGLCVMVSKEHGEYFLAFPSWSAAEIVRDKAQGVAVRLRAKEATPEEIDQALHVFGVVGSVSGQISGHMGSLQQQFMKMLGKDNLAEAMARIRNKYKRDVTNG